MSTIQTVQSIEPRKDLEVVYPYEKVLSQSNRIRKRKRKQRNGTTWIPVLEAVLNSSDGLPPEYQPFVKSK